MSAGVKESKTRGEILFHFKVHVSQIHSLWFYTPSRLLCWFIVDAYVVLAQL